MAEYGLSARMQQGGTHLSIIACLNALQRMQPVGGGGAQDLAELALALRKVDRQHADQRALADAVCLQHF